MNILLHKEKNKVFTRDWIADLRFIAVYDYGRIFTFIITLHCSTVARI